MTIERRPDRLETPPTDLFSGQAGNTERVLEICVEQRPDSEEWLPKVRGLVLTLATLSGAGLAQSRQELTALLETPEDHLAAACIFATHDTQRIRRRDLNWVVDQFEEKTEACIASLPKFDHTTFKILIMAASREGELGKASERMIETIFQLPTDWWTNELSALLPDPPQPGQRLPRRARRKIKMKEKREKKKAKKAGRASPKSEGSFSQTYRRRVDYALDIAYQFSRAFVDRYEAHDRTSAVWTYYFWTEIAKKHERDVFPTTAGWAAATVNDRGEDLQTSLLRAFKAGSTMATISYFSRVSPDMSKYLIYQSIIASIPKHDFKEEIGADSNEQRMKARKTIADDLSYIFAGLLLPADEFVENERDVFIAPFTLGNNELATSLSMMAIETIEQSVSNIGVRREEDLKAFLDLPLPIGHRLVCLYKDAEEGFGKVFDMIREQYLLMLSGRYKTEGIQDFAIVDRDLPAAVSYLYPHHLLPDGSIPPSCLKDLAVAMQVDEVSPSLTPLRHRLDTADIQWILNLFGPDYLAADAYLAYQNGFSVGLPEGAVKEVTEYFASLTDALDSGFQENTRKVQESLATIRRRGGALGVGLRTRLAETFEDGLWGITEISVTPVGMGYKDVRLGFGECYFHFRLAPDEELGMITEGLEELPPAHRSFIERFVYTYLASILKTEHEPEHAPILRVKGAEIRAGTPAGERELKAPAHFMTLPFRFQPNTTKFDDERTLDLLTDIYGEHQVRPNQIDHGLLHSQLDLTQLDRGEYTANERGLIQDRLEAAMARPERGMFWVCKVDDGSGNQQEVVRLCLAQPDLAKVPPTLFGREKLAQARETAGKHVKISRPVEDKDFEPGGLLNGCPNAQAVIEFQNSLEPEVEYNPEKALPVLFEENLIYRAQVVINQEQTATRKTIEVVCPGFRRELEEQPV